MLHDSRVSIQPRSRGLALLMAAGFVAQLADGLFSLAVLNNPSAHPAAYESNQFMALAWIQGPLAFMGLKLLGALFTLGLIEAVRRYGSTTIAWVLGSGVLLFGGMLALKAFLILGAPPLDPLLR